MNRDRRGLAVLVDALLFLAALSALSFFLMVPLGTAGPEEGRVMIRSFHSVMLAGEVPGDDGSALSRLPLKSFIAVMAQDRSITPAELGRVGTAVNGTLAELDAMGHSAWWVLSLDREEFIFGRPCIDPGVSIFADRRGLSGDGFLFVTLMVAA